MEDARIGYGSDTCQNTEIHHLDNNKGEMWQILGR